MTKPPVTLCSNVPFSKIALITKSRAELLRDPLLLHILLSIHCSSANAHLLRVGGVGIEYIDEPRRPLQTEIKWMFSCTTSAFSWGSTSRQWSSGRPWLENIPIRASALNETPARGKKNRRLGKHALTLERFHFLNQLFLLLSFQIHTAVQCVCFSGGFGVMLAWLLWVTIRVFFRISKLILLH